MKKIFTLVLASLISNAIFGQKSLDGSRQTSVYTYIYRASDAIVKSFYNRGTFDEGTLAAPVDSFLTARGKFPKLPPGNYVSAFAEKNRMKYELVEKRSAFLRIFDNGKDFQFILLDRQGRAISDARVNVEGQPVSFDPAAGLWHTRYPQAEETLISFSYEGITNYTKVSHKEEGFWTKLWRSRHLRSLYSPFVRLYYFVTGEDAPYRYRRNKWRPAKNRKKNINGYLVFNKPMYKPLDTLKFKAYLLNARTGAPCTETLDIVLENNAVRNVIGQLAPGAKGAYHSSIVLHDSLKLTLDYPIVITLARKNLTYRSESVRYEDYELKSVSFTQRGQHQMHSRKQQQALYFKAIDENGLNVLDGRVELRLVTQFVSGFRGERVFVRDTLWQHGFKLDALGETKIVVPDSIFPDADLTYRAEARFLNSSNESRVNNATYNFRLHDNEDLNFNAKNDSLLISLKNGDTQPVPAKVWAINGDGDTLSVTDVTLPCALKINPFADEYEVRAKDVHDWFEVKSAKAEIGANIDVRADSVIIGVVNPRKIPFWYTIIRNNRIVDRGSATHLDYRKAQRGNPTTVLKLDYVWGDEPRTETIGGNFADKNLTVQVNQPLTVSPGQTAEIEVTVSDAHARPVADADLTAYAYTTKFAGRKPFVPYFSRPAKSPDYHRPLEIEGADGSQSTMIDWQRWSKKLGLDTIEYFRFTHPQPVYRHVSAAAENLTQISPFVMKDGAIVPVGILYLNNQPVYFSGAEQVNRYAFRVDSGKVAVSFRFRNQLVDAGTVYVPHQKKLVVSFDLDRAPIQVTNLPAYLTQAESGNLSKYMIRVADTYSPRFGLLKQAEQTLLLRPVERMKWSRPSSILVGPLYPSSSTFEVKGKDPVSFVAEPGYSYTFEPGLIRQKSWDKTIPTQINASETSYTDQVLTNNEIDSLWLEYLDTRSHVTSLFPNPVIEAAGNGQLVIKPWLTDSTKSLPLIKSIFIYRYDNPDFMQAYPGRETALGYFRPGKYRIFLLLKGDRYVLHDDVEVRANGRNLVEISLDRPLPPDLVSKKLSHLLTERSIALAYEPETDADRLKETFNMHYNGPANYRYTMSGKVLDEKDKSPLPGCTVKIKGTNITTTTDAEGYFSIRVPREGKLVVQFLGFETSEVAVNHLSGNRIYLRKSGNLLQEVVVVGYGSQTRRSLMGSVAGVSVSQNVMIRGVGSVAGKPLYVIDGFIAEDGMNGISSNDIAEITALKDAAATALYGARATGGVIVITTKKGKARAAEEAASGSVPGLASMRRNFSDYAYWQPALRTNAEGKARFKVTFPDDITNWQTFVIAMGPHKQTGFADGNIKSFKPLSAAIATPAFALAGDTFSPIGKILNYTPETAVVVRQFSLNGKALLSGKLLVNNAHIDTLRITAAATDSLTFRYSFEKASGYTDGEERSVPVFNPGILETKGSFTAMLKDTTAAYTFDPALGKVTFHAESSPLPVLIDEAEHLRKYQHYCNEQIASKLQALLVQKKIATYLGKPFAHDKLVNQLIRKINENRRNDGLWGWWKNGDGELWISLHAIDALLEARKSGYAVKLDTKQLTEYLVSQLTQYRGVNKLEGLLLLEKLGATVNHRHIINEYEQQLRSSKKSPGLYEKFRLIALKQRLGLPISLDSVLSYKKSTLLGNVYFGKENNTFFDNSIQNSLLAYQILKSDGKHAALLTRITNFFLEQRGDGHWRNTYESALIMAAILPDLLAGDKQLTPPVLTLAGAETTKITSFPYTATLAPSVGITLTKTGDMPVYVTAYQQFWNSAPARVAGAFVVRSWFEDQQGRKLLTLKSGQPVALKVEVKASGDGDFVMVEVPVPAGCSYDEKKQNWWGTEVHREYFKDKVSIYCRKMKGGVHHFEIKLMPRYSGHFTLNPASAGLMYFPVFGGREALKKIDIDQ